jgi:hypothetical protein
VGVDQLGALDLGRTRLEAHLEFPTHPRYSLAVGENVGFAPRGPLRGTVLTYICVSTGDDPRDVELLAQHQLIVRLVDAHSHDVQGSYADRNAGWLHTVVVSRVDSLFRHNVTAQAAIQSQAFLQNPHPTYRDATSTAWAL